MDEEAKSDGLELGPTEQPQAMVQKEGVKPWMKVPDGAIRDMGTNHSLGYSGALRMLQPWDEFPGGGESLSLEMPEFCRT